MGAESAQRNNCATYIREQKKAHAAAEYPPLRAE
jgi:hypothetical protein